MKSIVINFLGGPSCGKTTMASLLFAELKIRGYVVEYVQEYAKTLVWAGDFDKLNNQYYVSRKQYDLLKAVDGKVDFIVTDGPLLHGLVYNVINEENVSDKDKTEKAILKFYNDFTNINIFLNRNQAGYEPSGRLQTEGEAKKIDRYVKEHLERTNIEYQVLTSDKGNIEPLTRYIINFKNVLDNS